MSWTRGCGECNKRVLILKRQGGSDLFSGVRIIILNCVGLSVMGEMCEVREIVTKAKGDKKDFSVLTIR